ncbi:hypothetical protein [Kineothrix sp. MB12-C1]|uniref:hypothetical protein n=1 Tax=Kineothrix sp. MB12-C1 TaxID=3070215 RepID=UPI0027D23699|nr:hypothetical protein [Kineothrix sp. MB12-C1]WMC94200.1 hypothetical protein RBB56_08060 [Kineothrix sp. MB12-C1]
MELPEVIRRIGKIENKRKIYIEAYVLSYLEQFKFEELKEGEQIILYGRKTKDISAEIYVIYGAGKRKIKEPDEAESLFADFEEVGCLNVDMWRRAEGVCEGILLGDGNGGQPLEGYYIFYEESPVMAKYLGYSHEEKIKRGLYARKDRPKDDDKEDQILPIPPVYDVIRAIVICIFIVICVIAITTVNSFEALEEFKEAAIWMSNALKEGVSGY